jgi:hypothetical protein
MKRALLTTMSTLLLVCLTATTVSAQSPHYKPKGGPTCSISGTTFQIVTCTGTVSGLGNFDVLVTLDGISGTGGTECQSPGGGNPAPGQNPGNLATSGAVLIPANQIKNGNLTFSVPTTIPTVTAAQAGCPNNNWTAALTSFTITTPGTGTLVVNQIINGVTTPEITTIVTF